MSLEKKRRAVRTVRARPTLEACKQTAASAGQVLKRGPGSCSGQLWAGRLDTDHLAGAGCIWSFISENLQAPQTSKSTVSAGEAKYWTSAASSFVDVAHLGHASSRSMAPATVAALRSAIQLWPLADDTFCKCFGKLLLKTLDQLGSQVRVSMLRPTGFVSHP